MSDRPDEYLAEDAWKLRAALDPEDEFYSTDEAALIRDRLVGPGQPDLDAAKFN